MPRLVPALCLLAACSPSIPPVVESGFTMATDSFPFPNFAFGHPQSQLDADGMVRMFGPGVCTSTTPPCALTAPARTWMTNANRLMTGGRCEGFAVASTLLFTKDLDANTFGAATPRSLDLEASAPLQHELAYWFSSQLASDSVARHTETYFANDVLPFLAKALAKNATERYRLGIAKKKGNAFVGGHSLTPIGYYADATEPGVYWLRVYDSNNPDTEQAVKLDTAKNEWSYEAARNPKERSSLYVGNSDNQNPMFFAPVRSRLGTVPCPFCPQGSGAQVIVSGGAQATVGDTGLRKGVVVGASLAFSGLDDDPASLVISTPDSSSFTVALASGDAPAALGSVTSVAKEFAVTLDGVTLQPGSSDLLHVTSAGSSVSYDNGSRSALALTSVLPKSGAGSMRVETRLSGASTTVGHKIDPATGDLSVTTTGSAGSMVTVVVTATDATGAEHSGQLTFAGGDSQTLTVKGNVFETGDILEGALTTDGTMKTVDDACFDGAKNGAESDIDCGGGCAIKCPLDAACALQTDCASGFCHATTGLCVATACVDGKKSPSETDVDCGGTCAGCSDGQTCALAADCRSGLCAGTTCAPTFAIGVAVTGLPGGATLVLQNNGADNLTVNGDGTYAFTRHIAGAYEVSISAQPETARCVVSNGSGTNASTATLAVVTCTPVFFIGGTVTGLPAGNTVTLLDNGIDPLSLTADGPFTFSQPVTAYAVTIGTQPTAARCTLSNGSGTPTADVTNLAVACSGPTAVSGTVTGLPSGDSFDLRNTLNSEQLHITADGPFALPTAVLDYQLTVVNLVSASGATCLVIGGTGSASPTTNVLVSCGYSVGGSSFLYGNSHLGNPNYDVVLELNGDGGETLIPPSPSYSFTTPVHAYSIAVSHQPDDGYCHVSNASGIATAPVLNASVSCGQAGAPELASAFSSPLENEYLAVATGPGSSSVLVGRDQLSASDDLWDIIKLNSAGGRELAFADGGEIRVNVGTGLGEVATAVASTTAGGFVVGGRFTAGASLDLGLLKLDPAGYPDLSFGDAGTVIDDLAGSDETVAGLVVLPTGAVVVAGSTSTGTTSDLYLVKYTPAGARDPAFGTAGLVTYGAAGTTEHAAALALDSNGRFVVVGSSGAADDRALAVRFTASGALDPSFGTGGVATPDLSLASRAHALTSVTPLSNGRLLVAGWQTAADASRDFALARLSSSGVLDSTFGTSGVFTQSLGSLPARATGVGLSSAGRVYLAGTSGTDGFVARFTANGALDPDFGTAGVSVQNPYGVCRFNGLALDADGHVLIAGSLGNVTSADFSLIWFVQ
jgi:uncharacterized delta-60 repeat protein